MMRIGIDMVKISRIAHSLSISDTFAVRVFAPNELDHIKGSPNRAAQEYLAGRFAVKEAVLKALRIGIGDEVSMCDIYTSTSVDGAPELHLTASALRAAEARTLSNWQVSISHENGMAIAFVIAL